MYFASTQAAEGFPRRAFTVAEIRRMIDAEIIAEDEPFELVEGDLVARFPKGNDHEIIKSELSYLFVLGTTDDVRVAVATTVYLDQWTFLEADLCLYHRGILPEEVKGTDVLLAIEVAEASLGYDRGLKARIYAKHGVRELWVVDAKTRETWVYLHPQPDGQWGHIKRTPPDSGVSPVALPEIRVRMSGLR